LRASGVATCPNVALLEALHRRIRATLRVHAIITTLLAALTSWFGHRSGLDFACQYFAIPDLLFFGNPSPILPTRMLRACGIATRPRVVFPVALHVGVGATLRLHTIVTAFHAIRARGLGLHKSGALPHLLVSDLPLVIFPNRMLGASLVATCPFVVLPETCHTWVGTTFGVDAIVAALSRSVAGRLWLKNFAVPNLLASHDPRSIFPAGVRVACLVATGPHVIPPEALHVLIGTHPRLHAVLATLLTIAFGCQCAALPHLLVTNLPSAIFPCGVLRTSLIATGPLIILLEASQLWVDTTFCVHAIIADSLCTFTRRLELRRRRCQRGAQDRGGRRRCGRLAVI